MFHLHNGDATADTARNSSLPGEHLAWRESLITGPTPAGLSDGEWRCVRARHLSEAYGEEVPDCERGLLGQEQALASFSEHDEVVLWFEHDLFCQLHLVYLLNWFSQRGLGKTRLSLICIGEFPGIENFHGLGELNAEELASLFPGRLEVTKVQMELAAAAWRAYCSPAATDIEKLLQEDTSPLPFLKEALKAHLARFPSVKNGLGRIENRALKFLQDGLSSFLEVFPKFSEAEPVYGFGDAQFWIALQRLSAARQPLLTIEGLQSGEPQKAHTPDFVRRAKLRLTQRGESALKGETDFVALNGIDLWLGGVHLHDGKDHWRWDEQLGRLLFNN
jgi:hypothetical protein